MIYVGDVFVHDFDDFCWVFFLGGSWVSSTFLGDANLAGYESRGTLLWVRFANRTRGLAQEKRQTTSIC